MKDLLKRLNISPKNFGAFGAEAYKTSGPILESRSPIDGQLLATVVTATKKDYDRVVSDAEHAFGKWRSYPAPKRGEIVRQIGEALRAKKKELGLLVTLEVGKILSEGEGEIQEAIDIADFSVGLSRQLYGLTIQSERPAHRMMEQWHPLGVVGVITAFNFPAAVWAWNSMVGAVCGDSFVWKPSEAAPLTAIAMNTICAEIAEAHGFPGLFGLVIGNGPELGKTIAADRRIPLVSATGSTAMGRSVAEVVGRRLGRCILELGGNNAIVVCDDADLNLVVPAVAFGAVGTAGQRCTSTRRILIEKNIEPAFTRRLMNAYKQVKIGDPTKSGVLMGPLIHQRAVDAYRDALRRVRKEGGKILCGGDLVKGAPSPLYVQPTIVKASPKMSIVQEETFAPILYIISIKNLDDAIRVHNGVPQGLSSAIFTKDIQKAERFLSATGSDCGIANVNIGTSGAEIGGAFGGEKDTGGGRESGSDSWKQYMRRQTSTVNYSNDLPLAQGIRFDVRG